MDYLDKIGSKWWKMLLLSMIPFFIILAPLLFNGQIFLNGDLVNWVYPIYHFYQDSLANSQSIFWNPNNFSGFPSFIGSMGFLSPFHYFLFQWLPLFTAYNFIIFLDLTLALFFFWQLLKKFNLGFWAGFIGGLVYVFSQWSWAHDITVVSALPLLPLLFLILWQLKEKNNNWLIIFGGLIIGYGWLSVHFNWLIMILSAGALFSLWLGWSDNKKWLIPFKFFLMLLMGTLVGLLIIFPLLTYGSLSARAEGLSYNLTARGTVNFGDLLRFVLPYFKLSVFKFAASPAQLYLGVLPLFFLFFAFKLRSSLTNFFCLLFSFCFLITISYSPLFWLLHQLPVFNSFRGPHRWMFIGSFSAAILVGFGLKYFLSQEGDKWKNLLLKIFKWLGWFVLSLSLVFSSVLYFFKNKFIALAQNYFDQHLYSQTSGLPLGHYHQVIQGMFSELERVLSILNPKVFLSIIFIFISYFILTFFNKRKTAKNFLPLIALVVFLNFLLIFFNYHPTISKEEFPYQPATVDFIKKDISQLPPFTAKRIFSFLPGFSEYQKLTVPYQPQGIEPFIFQSEMVAANLNLFYGLETVDYYDNLMSRPMSRILALIGSDRATSGEKLANLKIPLEEKVKKFQEEKKLLDLLSVHYIISVFPLDEQKFPKIFETSIPPYNIPVAIYENKQARPLFYLADKVETVEPNEERAYQKLLEEPLTDKYIFIECADCPKELEVNGQGEIILEEKENSFARLTIKSVSPQWLVFSENYLPGWQAYLDNQPIFIYRTNTVYMAVFVPAGEHQVLFKYNPYYTKYSL